MTRFNNGQGLSLQAPAGRHAAHSPGIPAVPGYIGITFANDNVSPGAAMTEKVSASNRLLMAVYLVVVVLLSYGLVRLIMWMDGAK